jgi:hypothetical protein
LGPLTDPFKEAPESSLPVDNKEEEKLPSQKLVTFKFSTMEDSAPPYAGLYPSLAPFKATPQTGTIPKKGTKQGEENEEVSLEKTFRQLLLEEGNDDSSPPSLAPSPSENPLGFRVILGPLAQ